VSVKVIYKFDITDLHLRETLLACSSSLDDSSPSARHVFVLASSSGLKGHKRTYLTILESADYALSISIYFAYIRQMQSIELAEQQ
jgi:hypothetical protein